MKTSTKSNTKHQSDICGKSKYWSKYKRLKRVIWLRNNYLKKIAVSLCLETGKVENKGIAFVLSQDHLHNELLKLNGIAFHGKI